MSCSEDAMAAARAGSSRGEGELWSRLPPSLVELVLSFLPVPVLCRFRTVCKEWNELLCGPRFHDLYAENGKQHHEVCFLTRYMVKDGYSCIDLAVKGTTCFLDLHERRWYSIECSKRRGFDTRVVAMDDGLVAEFWCDYGEQTEFVNDIPTVSCVSMSDPISKHCWTLERPFFDCPADDELLTLVVAADRSSCSFRLFLLVNSTHVADWGPLLWVYESSTDKWKCAKYLPKLLETNLYTKATSAVSFRGDVYVILSPFSRETCFLMRYDCQEDKWSMVVESDLIPDQHAHPQLHVSGNRLLMTFWRSRGSLAKSKAKPYMPADTMLKMVEIQMIAENNYVLRRVFGETPIPLASMERFGGEMVEDLACVAPRVNSDGTCSSVVLVSSFTGRVIDYDMVSHRAEVLPTHPLRKPRGMTQQSNHRRLPHVRYWGSHQKLCFRNLLRTKAHSHPPVYMPKA